MKAIIQIISVTILVSLGAGCLPYTTNSNEVAVITDKGIIGGKGVREQFQERGTTKFLIPFLTDWHSFEVSQQKLEMTITRARGDDLTFKTIDGNDVSLDLIVTYTIMADQAPYILQNVAVNNLELEENIIRTIARSIPRDLFGELESEEFYVSAERSKKADEVREKLNQLLSEYGVRVDSVGPQDYRFNKENNGPNGRSAAITNPAEWPRDQSCSIFASRRANPKIMNNIP